MPVKCSRVPSACGIQCSTEHLVDPEIEEMVQIRAAQSEDYELVVWCDYLESGALPEDTEEACRVVIESEVYKVIEVVLHFELVAFPENCVIVLKMLRPSFVATDFSPK